MLELTPGLEREIQALGAAAYPYEGCGLLLGLQNGERNVVEALFPVENRWEVEEEKRERFMITPEAMFQAEMAAMRQGLDIVGIFHSHPDHPPVASPRDLAWATWPGYSYLITEVRGGQAGASRSWQLAEDRSGFLEEPLQVCDQEKR
ncbi:MAG: M67 family metallopeptidase [Anaerolineae bacterium]|nr:M67 family metallopeptidase [Anaerolineae bacterium]